MLSDERLDYAILISLAMREEAEVMASALRAEGVDAFVGNRHHANVDWGWTLAMGGMQVFVPRQRIAEAKEVIRDRIREALANPEGKPAKRRDHWKVWAVIAGGFVLGLFGINPGSANTLDGDRERQLRDAEWQRNDGLSAYEGYPIAPLVLRPDLSWPPR